MNEPFDTKPAAASEDATPQSTKGHNECSRCAEAMAEIEQMNAVFSTRWRADMRAIRLWQAETGKTGIWPDHADLVVWLMKKLERSQDALVAAEEYMTSPPEERTFLALQVVRGAIINDFRAD